MVTNYGHMTMADGSRVPLTKDAADAMIKEIEDSCARREKLMPDEAAAINAMHEAYTRLRDFGWSDAIYCPKDGTHFEVIENGSTGVFDCVYSGNWPDGYWMTFDDRDCYPSSKAPAMYRLYPEDEAKRKVKMAEAAARFRAEQDET